MSLHYSLTCIFSPLTKLLIYFLHQSWQVSLTVVEEEVLKDVGGFWGRFCHFTISFTTPSLLQVLRSMSEISFYIVNVGESKKLS